MRVFDILISADSKRIRYADKNQRHFEKDSPEQGKVARRVRFVPQNPRVVAAANEVELAICIFLRKPVLSKQTDFDYTVSLFSLYFVRIVFILFMFSFTVDQL